MSDGMSLRLSGCKLEEIEAINAGSEGFRLICGLTCDVVNNHGDRRVADVRRYQRPEALLAGGVLGMKLF